ncbi:hypothetical protein [Yinghuangia soli]|uniref:DUF389 domain-containing protein n=1 Tax=Yinghuangia soli TaxID=2908204 RepID=A0AA41PWF1_9ACTN|nr:hypothetical protein [Yinghuangia soli]MCF2526595.1 hypothetical protein [Yinghuangia soli]
MPAVDTPAVQRMTAALFIEKSWRSPSSTRFWGLLLLAAVIASAGVVGDSTATVIGAMIVAPLMTPILGSALAVVLADRAHLVRIAARGTADVRVGELRGKTLAVVAAMLLLVAVPLTTGTAAVARDRQLADDAKPVAEQWAAERHWAVNAVDALGGRITVTTVGLPPVPPLADLRTALDKAGMDDADVEVHLIGGGTRRCPAGSTTCFEP